MSLAVGLVVIVGAVVAQVSMLPAFSIFGAQPNLIIVILVAWLAVRGQREALVLIPVAGLALGVFDSHPLGLAMLALVPLGVMTELRELRPVESNLVPALVITALATLFYEGTFLLASAVTGGHAEWGATALNVLVPAAIANVLLLLPVYALMRLTSMEVRRRPAF